MAKKKFLVFQGKKYLINANVKGEELTKSLAKIITNHMNFTLPILICIYIVQFQYNISYIHIFIALSQNA